MRAQTTSGLTVLAALVLGASLLFACEGETPGLTAADAIPNEEGGALLAEATRAALRAVSERKTATLAAATLDAALRQEQAQRTRAAQELAATETAQAQQVRQTDMAANATANALALAQVSTRQAATETSQAQRADATATAQAHNLAGTQTAELRALALSASQTAAAIQATATTYAATRTRGAEEIAAALAQHQATATAEALERQRTQAIEDAARAAQWLDFVDYMTRLVLTLAVFAVLVLVLVFAYRYLDALATRQRLVETRAGTVLIVAGPGGYAAQLVQPAPLLDAGDAFDVSQAPTITHEADDLLKLTTGKGETFITRTDPLEEQRAALRRLAMRLLRESIRHYAAKGIDPRTVNRVPTYRDLDWSSETWVRAVNALKPHVVTRQGRGGGTFCGPQFPNLVALYIALGERRIELL